MRLSKGFTILELIMVVILIAILAGIGIPSYRKAVEKSIARSAVMNLQVIYNAEKVYKLDNGEFYTCVGCDIDDINDALETFVKDDEFTYDISSVDDNDDGEQDGFRATATRLAEGICAGKTITVTEEGGDPEKGCTVW